MDPGGGGVHDAPPVTAPEPQLGPIAARPLLESDAALSVFLVLLLATTVLGWPLRDAGADGVLVALRVVTAVMAVLAVAPNRAHALLAGVAALAVVYGQVFAHERSPAQLGARLALFGVVAASLLLRVFSPGRVTIHRLLGAVSLYVLLAVIWGTGYQLVIVLRPDAIRGSTGPASLDDAMWLSFITITTTGYGDVLPSSALARSLSALEALVGVLYPAILISRLVSLVQSPASQRGDGGGKSSAA